MRRRDAYYVSRTWRGKRLPGEVQRTSRMDGSERKKERERRERGKNRILRQRQNQNRGADSFLHADPVGALIQFCIVR